MHYLFQNNWKNYLLILVVGVLMSCPLLRAQDHIDTAIVLRTGAVSISRYELEKNLKVFTDSSREMTNLRMKDWFQSFIDRVLLLSDAYQKGYGRITDVQKWVSSMEHYVISRPGGLLEERLVAEADAGVGNDSSTRNFLNDSTRAIRRQWIIRSYYDEVNGKAKLNIDPHFLQIIEKSIREKGPIRVFSSHQFEGVPSHIMSYQFENSLVSVTAGEFESYYNTLLLRKQIDSIGVLVYYLHAMVWDRYNYTKAVELGITNEPKFLLDKKNYEKDVVLAAYEREELIKGIFVSEEEIKERYDSIKSFLGEATDAVVSVFYFAERGDAIKAMLQLGRPEADSSVFRHALCTEWHRVVNYRDDFFSDSTKRAVFEAQDKRVLRPFAADGKIILVYKEFESGARVPGLHEVKHRIIKELELEQLVRKRKELLSTLKIKYPLLDKVNYSRYMQP